MDVRPATDLASPRATRGGGPGRDRRFVLGAVGVAVLAAWAYLPHLTTSTLLIDERVYLEAGQQYVDGDVALNREHPPLAKLLFGLVGRALGEPVLGGRLVGVAAGVAIAVAVFVLVRRMAGRGWGLVAAGLWVVLPHTLRMADLAWGGFDRLDRYAMLDPVATALAMWALVAAVHWSDEAAREPPGRLRWAVVAGALVGLAAGAKLSGALVGPVVAATPWLTGWRRWSWRTVAASVTVGAIAVAAFALAYLPLGGEAVEVFRDMVAFQGRHAASGHDVVVAGRAYPSAPWWAQGWYAWRDEGGLVVVALSLAAVVGAVAGGGPGRRRDRGLVTAAVVVPVAVLAASPVLLPHYRFLWLPSLVVLASVGVATLARRPERAARLLALVLVGMLLVTGTRSLAYVSTQRPAGYRAAAELLHQRDLADAAVLVEGFPGLLGHYAPAVTFVERLPAADVVVLDPVRTDLRPVPGLLGRLADEGWEHTEVDHLDVWVRP